MEDRRLVTSLYIRSIIKIATNDYVSVLRQGELGKVVVPIKHNIDFNYFGTTEDEGLLLQLIIGDTGATKEQIEHLVLHLENVDIPELVGQKLTCQIIQEDPDVHNFDEYVSSEIYKLKVKIVP